MTGLGAVDAAGRSTAEAVEEALYRHRQPLFGAVSIAFLDTTTLWFEGAGGESLGQYGHSKDYRGHLKQVVLGIVLDDADRPIASLLMPGNTADVTLLLPVVKRLRERFGIREACIVADRGGSAPTPSLRSKPRRSNTSSACASAPAARCAPRSSKMTASPCRSSFPARKARPNSRSARRRSPGGAT